MATTSKETHTEKTEKNSSNDTPPPAGGAVDAKVEERLMKMLENFETGQKRTVGKKILDASIPAGIALAGGMLVAGGTIYLQRRQSKKTTALTVTPPTVSVK